MKDKEWDKYSKLLEKMQKDCSVWLLVDEKTGRKAGEVIMRFTPNPYGRFGRGGIRLCTCDGTAKTFIANATAGGCGYSKTRHMMEVMLRELADPIKEYWGVDVEKFDTYNYYGNVFESMGLIMYEVI